MLIVEVLDFLLFLIFLIPAMYLAFFAFSSLLKTREPEPTPHNPHSFLILIPAYKEDKVILGSVEACVNQLYPKDKYQIVVIAQGMQSETINRLRELSVVVQEVEIEHPTKAKALNKALRAHANEGWELALIFDADNLPEPLFLQKMNAKFHEGVAVVQGHRTAKNTNNSMAVLDAMSEEINNSIFRKGHYNLGFSSALIGSGMAFRYDQFNAIMRHVDVVGGFDKELEHIYLMNQEKIHYLHSAMLLDEKVQRKSDFEKQRRRWMAAQWEHFSRFFPLFVMALKQKNFDFCNKLFQMILLPRILILGGTMILAITATLINPIMGIKWWLLVSFFALALIIAIPSRIVSKQLFLALFTLPHLFVIVLLNLFKLKNANKKFIHTPHHSSK